jgi:hypothetical protein
MSFTLICNECGSEDCTVTATDRGRNYDIEIRTVCENCGHED